FKLPADVAKTIGGSDTTLGKVMAAREAGQEVWMDQYPYTASSTSISTMLPDWVLEKGHDEARKMLTDPAQLERVLRDMKENNEEKRHRRTVSYVEVAAWRGLPAVGGG